MEAALAYTLLTAASGAVQYIGAQRNAKQLEYNAEAVNNQAEYDAAVARNNALAERQTVDFQNSVEVANRNRLIQKSEDNLRILRREADVELAQAEVRFGYGGTFSDYMDSLENDAFEKELSFVTELADETTSSYLRMGELDRQATLITQQGDVQARNILLGGQNQANNLRNQAGNVRVAGFADMLGSFGQAGMGYKTMKG
jgi:hypothetical protein